MKIIRVKLEKRSYPIFIGHDVMRMAPSFVESKNVGNYGVILTSKKIAALYKKQIAKTFNKKKYHVVVVPDGEQAKSKECLFKVLNQIVKVDTWGRNVFVVCVGGGTIGDLGGFTAAIYKRGIPCIQVPTTLLAQVDASIGGKTAIDLKVAKNILGAFHQPRAVFIDPGFLGTLPNRELRQGLAETVKYGVIKDQGFFTFLHENSEKILALSPFHIAKLIHTCVQIKARVVEADEYETKGVRTILNFGHTLAHALEAAHQYQQVTHGEAVAMGMVYAAHLSCQMHACEPRVAQDIAVLLKKFGLPTATDLDYARISQAMSYDKKFISGKVRMVLVKRIGKVEVVEGITLKVIEKTLRKWAVVH